MKTESDLSSSQHILGQINVRILDESERAHFDEMLESFVDEHLGYEGTCYKACNFEAAGPSAGYGRSSRLHYPATGGRLFDRPERQPKRHPRNSANQTASRVFSPADMTAAGSKNTGG